MKTLLKALVTVLLAASAFLQAAPNNPNTDWFQQAGWGVFVHYLEGLQNNPAVLNSLGRRTSWDQYHSDVDAAQAIPVASAQSGPGAGVLGQGLGTDLPDAVAGPDRRLNRLIFIQRE